MCIETPVGVVASAIVRVHPHASELAQIYRLEQGLGLSAVRVNDDHDRDSALGSGFHLELLEPLPSAEAMVFCELDSADDDPPQGWVTPALCRTGSHAIDALPDHRCAVLFSDLPNADRIVHVHVVRVDLRAPQLMSPMLRPASTMPMQESFL